MNLSSLQIQSTKRGNIALSLMSVELLYYSLYLLLTALPNQR